jgi:archaellum component FlaC
MTTEKRFAALELSKFHADQDLAHLLPVVNGLVATVEDVVATVDDLNNDITLVGEQGQSNTPREDHDQLEEVVTELIGCCEQLTRVAEAAQEQAVLTNNVIRAEVKVKDTEIRMLRQSLKMVTNAVLDLLADRNVDEVNPVWTHEDNLNEVVAILGDGWGA